MPVKSVITDSSTKHSVKVHTEVGEDNALVVVTRPLKTYDNAIVFFANDVGSVDMAVNGSASGTLETLTYDENAGAATEWNTANVVDTKFDFAHAGPGVGPYQGSVCIDGRSTGNNDAMELQQGGSFDLTPYTLIKGWINIAGWSGGGAAKDVRLQAYNSGVAVGNWVDIGDYVNTGTLNVWQQFVVPLADMGATGATITAFRITTVDIGGGPPPNYWLDLIQLVGSITTGGPQTFSIAPGVGKILHIYQIRMLYAAVDSTGVDGSTNQIPYDSLLGVDIPVGITYQRFVDGEVQSTFIVSQLSDVLQIAGSEVSYGGDGTNTWIMLTMSLKEPLSLNWKTADVMRVTINDDLTGLSLHRSSILGREEDRPLENEY